MILSVLSGVRLFKNWRQIGILLVFSVSILIFRAISFSGKVVMVLFSNIYITENGLLSGVYFLSQILMIFLLGQFLLRSTPSSEFRAILSRLQQSDGWLSGNVLPFFRMSWFIVSKTPQYLSEFRSVTRTLRGNLSQASGSYFFRLALIKEALVNFVLLILQRTEEDYQGVTFNITSEVSGTGLQVRGMQVLGLMVFLFLFHWIGFGWGLF